MAAPVFLHAYPAPPQELMCRRSGARFTAASRNGQQGPERLGVGGYGEVYLYRDASTDQLVAVKRVALNGVNLDKAERLRHSIPLELKNHRKFNHPLVVKMLHVFIQDGYLHIVLEFVPGGNLLGYVNSKPGPLSEADARWLFQQLVVTLDYLHAMGVSHRDIKLENTLTAVSSLPQPPGSEERPDIKVADFGLSKHAELTGTDVGTRQYKPPEIVRVATSSNPAADTRYDGRKADVWAAGVLLYALLQKNYPFQVPRGATPEQHLHFIRQQHPGVLQSIDAMACEEGCKELLRRMLQLDPDQRISVAQIMNNTWFQTELSPELLTMKQDSLNLPSPCACNEEQLLKVWEAAKQMPPSVSRRC